MKRRENILLSLKGEYRWLLAIGSLFLIWRLGLFIVAAIAPVFISQFGDRFPYWQERLVASQLPQFVWSFANFDGVHYLGIAKDGYAYQFTQAFFPLYPILIRLFSQISSFNLIISGLLVANVSFFAGLIIFYKLVAEKFDASIAFWSITFLLTFPTSFYFGSVYTEGLFFLLTVSAFYLMEKNKIITASALAGLTSATKFVGIFLVPALLVSTKLKSIWPLLIGPLGILAYMLYLYLAFDNPFYFLTSQQIFGQERETTTIVLLPQVVYRYLKIFLTTSGLPVINAAFELTMTMLALAALIFIRKKIPTSWLIFSLAAVLVPTLTGTLASMPRYILIAFPIYIALATLGDWKLKTMIALFFMIILFISTILFTRGYWVA